MIPNQVTSPVSLHTETDPTRDYYHTFIEGPKWSSLQKAVFSLLKNERLTATNTRGDYGVWFQQGYPTNTEEEYHLRFLEGHALQPEKAAASFGWCISRGDVPLDTSKLQVICRDEITQEQLVRALEQKGFYVQATGMPSMGLIIGDDRASIPLVLLRQFNQTALLFVQSRYDTIAARFGLLEHPPEVSYLKSLEFHRNQRYREHFELVNEFKFWTGVLEKVKKVYKNFPIKS